MSSSVSEDQDQRSNGGLEDLTTMTIESLRARLLAERAISKTARQRADELAKRVLELEDQLKTISLQRKRAEKATANVLAILESNGVTDHSGEFDSSSDGETTISDSKVSNHTSKMEGTSADFDVRRHSREAYSSSEIDSSSTGRSLSWKCSKESPNFMERKKFMDSGRRRSSSFASSSTLQKRVGKSCRRIRRRETRPVAEELHDDSNMHDNHVDRVATCSQDLPNSRDIGSETVRDDPENHEVENPREASFSGFPGNVVSEANVSGRTEQDKTMERTLHEQAQKKADEAEENAQREWEENCRENNSSAPDSCDPGNRSDVTEERDEMKAPSHVTPGGRKNSPDQGTELEISNASSFTADHKPKDPKSLTGAQQVDIRNSQGLTNSSMVNHDSPLLDFAFPMSNGTRGKDLSGDSNSRPSPSSYTCSLANGSSGKPLVHAPLANENNGESSESSKELALMPPNSSSNLDSILEALQQAKLSLKGKLYNGTPAEVGYSGKGIEPFVPAPRSRDEMEIPVGCPEIFRLPTDFQFERATKGNYLRSDSAPSLPYHPSEIARYNLMSSPYVETRSSLFAGDRFWTSPSPPYMAMRSGTHMGSSPDIHTSAVPYTENYSGIATSRPVFEPALNASFSGRTAYLDPRSSPGLPPPSTYSFPTYPAYQDTRPHLPSDARFSRNASMEVGTTPSAAQFSLYDNHIRPSDARFSRNVSMEVGATSTTPAAAAQFSLYDNHIRPSDARFSRNASMEVGTTPSAAQFSLYDNHIRPNMYK